MKYPEKTNATFVFTRPYGEHQESEARVYLHLDYNTGEKIISSDKKGNMIAFNFKSEDGEVIPKWLAINKAIHDALEFAQKELEE